MADKEKIHNLAAAMQFICDPDFSKNPLAWARLEHAGITREILAEIPDQQWSGPRPFFQNAPDRESEFWKFLLSQEEAKETIQ